MIPVIDTSQHQGPINYRTLRATHPGRLGLIHRSNHTTSVDAQFVRNIWNAAEAGFPRRDQGVYNFENPKRADPARAAEIWLETIYRAWGDLDTFFMLDIESYHRESPGTGQWPKAQYAAWLRAKINRMRQLDPGIMLIGYTNRSYFDPYVGAPDIAQDVDWIVARYILYSHKAYDSAPALPLPADWDEWVKHWPTRLPQSPTGAPAWPRVGWQFSAGYNRQGPRYGCVSEDLDLNIVPDELWAEWTRTKIQPQPERPAIRPPTVRTADMANVVNNAQDRDMGDGHQFVNAAGETINGWPSGFVKYTIEFNKSKDRHEKHHVDNGSIGVALFGSPENALSNADLDAIPDWSGETVVGTVQPGPMNVTLDIPSVPGRATGTAHPA